MKVLALTKYGRMGASSRMRSIQYAPFFLAAGCDVTFSALLTDELLEKRYREGRYATFEILRVYIKRALLLKRRREFDLIWIEKEAFPWLPEFVESMLLSSVPYVLDYDDAVFHVYDRHPNRIVRFLFGSRLDRLMSKAALVVAGNGYLAKRAIDAGARRVELLPTVIDIDRYPATPDSTIPVVPHIVWIGSPSTANYLNLLREPLRELARKTPFVLRVIGAKNVDMPGVDVEIVQWTEATEVESIASCAIGIMPLQDSHWEMGKCGYKLIQYMACSLPVVASSVGANLEIVKNGKNGFLATTSTEWVNALEILLKSSVLRKKMGSAGRSHVEHKYCLQVTGPRLVRLLRAASSA